MLISVYGGVSRDGARSVGTLHFQIAPQFGDQVELHGSKLIVREVWHLPDEHFAGPKLAILVSERAISSAGSDAEQTAPLARILA